MPIRSKTYFESYYEDIKLFKTLWIKVWLVVFAAGLLTLPLYGGAYLVYLINLSCLAVIGGLGLNLLTGYTGQISLGHAAFLAVGAYTTALLGGDLSWPFFLTLPARRGRGRPVRRGHRHPLPEAQGAIPGHGHHVFRGGDRIPGHHLGEPDRRRARPLRAPGVPVRL